MTDEDPIYGLLMWTTRITNYLRESKANDRDARRPSRETTRLTRKLNDMSKSLTHHQRKHPDDDRIDAALASAQEVLLSAAADGGSRRSLHLGVLADTLRVAAVALSLSDRPSSRKFLPAVQAAISTVEWLAKHVNDEQYDAVLAKVASVVQRMKASFQKMRKPQKVKMEASYLLLQAAEALSGMSTANQKRLKTYEAAVRKIRAILNKGGVLAKDDLEKALDLTFKAEAITDAIRRDFGSDAELTLSTQMNDDIRAMRREVMQAEEDRFNSPLVMQREADKVAENPSAKVEADVKRYLAALRKSKWRATVDYEAQGRWFVLSRFNDADDDMRAFLFVDKNTGNTVVARNGKPTREKGENISVLAKKTSVFRGEF